MPERPNVILLALDTLRADRLGCYGYPKPTSPALDEFAAAGVLFEEFITPHLPTSPGFTTMFAGKDIVSHQRAMLGGPVEPDESVRTLAELLAAEGYQTAAVDCWHSCCPSTARAADRRSACSAGVGFAPRHV